MTVYFYHTQDTRRILREWKEGTFPSHLLYGAAQLPDCGISVIPHLYPVYPPHQRLRLTWLTTWRILRCRQHYDAVYATSFRGLEGIILLRALHLFRKPIVLWHHQPVVRSANKWRERLSRFFYRGIDRLFFFSTPLVEASQQAGKVDAAKMQVLPWGSDLPFYDRLRAAAPEARVAQEATEQRPFRFISTGKEMRDLPTLVTAFGQTGLPLDMYINTRNGQMDYTAILGGLQVPANVQVHVLDRLMIGELAAKVARAQCVVICCQPTTYTVGLTTLVEALALGLPVISTRNATFPFDIDAEGVDITVDYGDTEGWTRAIRYMNDHPAEAAAMGRRARLLAERTFNIQHTATEVCKALCQLR